MGQAWKFLSAVLLGLCVTSGAARAEDPAYLTIGAGAWEALRGNLTEPELDVTYRSDYRVWAFKPQIGVLAAKDGDYYVYTGLLSDLYMGKHFVLTPSFNVGFYDGGGFDLGSHFEFREGLEVAYRFENKVRVGFAFYHMSNAGLSSRNPGSESALLTYSIPLGTMFSRESLAQARAPQVAMTRFSTGSPMASGQK